MAAKRPGWSGGHEPFKRERERNRETGLMKTEGLLEMQSRHFSVRTLAELWNLSEDTIQRWFVDEAGVLKVGESGTRRRGCRVTLRIPEAVALRVYREKTR